MLAIETASIGVDQWMGHAADPAASAASAALTPVFAVLTMIGVVVLGIFLRRGPRTGQADYRPRAEALTARVLRCHNLTPP
jgi:hypothetical protein